MRETALPSLAALLVQPLVFLLWFGDQFMSVPPPLRDLGLLSAGMLAIAAAHLVIVGLPLFFLFRHMHRLSWATAFLSGLLSGTIVPALLGWPLQHRPYFSVRGDWHGRDREFFIDGVPTMYGWLQYLEGLLLLGLHGVAGALVFYFVWRRVRPNNSSKPTPLRGAA